MEIINCNDKKVYFVLWDLFFYGLDVVIEVVGFYYVLNFFYKVEVVVGMEIYILEIINEFIYCVCKGGCIGIVGDYIIYCK